MSLIFEVTNAIKERADLSWLTSSQRICFEAIMRELRYPSLINLYGDCGSGKTFLGWIIQQETSGYYLPLPKSVKELQPLSDNIFIIDNCSWTRIQFREILKQLQFLSITKAVIITRQKIQDDILAIKLELTSEDISTVLNNLRKIGYICPARDISNLWELFTIHKGGDHA